MTKHIAAAVLAVSVLALSVLALSVLAGPMAAVAETGGTETSGAVRVQARVKPESTQSGPVVRTNANSATRLAQADCPPPSWLASFFGISTTNAGCGCGSAPCAESLILGVGF